MNFLIIFLIAVLAIILYTYFLSKGKYLAISTWSKYVDNFNHDPIKIYEKVQAIIESKKIEDLKFKVVEHSEGIMAFSSNRKYLEITRKDLKVLLCCAPFGTTYLFSHWLLQKATFFQAMFSKIPILGPLLVSKVMKETFYTKDTESVFLAVVEASYLEAINENFSSNGLRKLQAEDLKISFDNRFQSKISG